MTARFRHMRACEREIAMRLGLGLSVLFVGAALGACATTPNDPEAVAAGAAAPYASSYVRRPYAPVLIRAATVLDGQGGEFANADVLFQDGAITAVGAGLTAPAGAEVIDGEGRFVTPGIIDVHSHLGVYPSPSINATSDGNELTQPNTAEVWAEHSVWPMDPGFSRAVAGGITTLHVLPGSGNLFGGRGVTLRPVLGARTVQEMKFPDAPQSLKMACGENPARVYGERNSSPATGMGVVAGWRQSFVEAQQYQRRWAEYREKQGGEDPPDPPDRNLELETLAGVLDGDIIVQWHCYRADEMATAIALSHEFGFQIAAFHHAVEAYKVGDLLARENVCAAMWADWWGFKIEAYDGIRENIPFVHAQGGCAVVHSDSEVGIQRLNQEAAKALSDGRRAGIEVSRGEAWTWLSRNPARVLRIDDRTGALAPGLAADVVVWSADPFSTYAVAERVYMDGALAYQRGAPGAPSSDFELGQAFREGAQ
jgi:imidazolonepropionase-like amidohydrolase